MYCDKPNVNLLTSYLLAYDIRHIVVCPGSRNAILVHNFSLVPEITCHAVTDERSAAFVALGITAATGKPAAVCVTSGSALLNTLPAAAEAFYRHLPLLIISADRPPEWIGQQDGQTIPQQHALNEYTVFQGQIHEIANDATEKWTKRLLSEALLSLHEGPVHLNVPISEPLFNFTTSCLPLARPVRLHREHVTHPWSTALVQRLKDARCPILVVGQIDEDFNSETFRALVENQTILVLPEVLSQLPESYRTKVIEELNPGEFFSPDLVLHVGGTFVNKKLKLFLRQSQVDVIRLAKDKHLVDTFNHLTDVIPVDSLTALHMLNEIIAKLDTKREVTQALQKLSAFRSIGSAYTSTLFSDLTVTQAALKQLSSATAIHMANSSPVRNILHFIQSPTGHIYCNRGTNGIEGTLSTSVGHALVCDSPVYCFIGDLSFFYDQNALWNTELGGNLHILLFNNGGGQIFKSLPGLTDSPAARKYISASHHTTARGLAESYNLVYFSASTLDELDTVLPLWTKATFPRPTLLEVFTTPEANTIAAAQIHQLYLSRSQEIAENAPKVCL